MKNIHKRKNLMGIIYAIIMLIPLLSVLVRTCYVTFNKNAYQSYTSTYVNTTQNLSGQTQIVENREFIATHLSSGTANSYLLGFKSISIDLQALTGTDYQYNCINFLSDNKIQLRVYDFDSNTSTGLITITFNSSNENLLTNFTFVSNGRFYNNSTSLTNLRWKLQYNIYNEIKLDNAFEYSLQRVTDNSNIGRLNLINWFVDIFLDSTNSTNALYLNFINWYLNYTLLVSCMYLLYLVLMWFINLARRILSKGFNEEI